MLAPHRGEQQAELLALGENALSPPQHLRALRREALKPLATLDDLDPELGLELAYAGGQCGLRHVA